MGQQLERGATALGTLTPAATMTPNVGNGSALTTQLTGCTRKLLKSSQALAHSAGTRRQRKPYAINTRNLIRCLDWMTWQPRA